MLGFLISVAAGALTPMIESPVARPAAKALSQNIDVQDGEVRVLAFMIAMIVAGILCAVFGTGSALGLAVGGALGYFGGRILRAIQKIIEGRRD